MAATASPPGPPRRFPGAHVLAFHRQALEFLCQVSRTYGDVASFPLGLERVVLVIHPNAIRDVLVTHHRAFSKARRGDVNKQFLGEALPGWRACACSPPWRSSGSCAPRGDAHDTETA